MNWITRLVDFLHPLTHWGRVTHICVSKLTSIGPDNGLSPGRRQAIIWDNDIILLIWPLGTKLREILIAIRISSFKTIQLKMPYRKWRPFYLGLNMLKRKLCRRRHTRDLTTRSTVWRRTSESNLQQCHRNVLRGKSEFSRKMQSVFLKSRFMIKNTYTFSLMQSISLTNTMCFD